MYAPEGRELFPLPKYSTSGSYHEGRSIGIRFRTDKNFTGYELGTFLPDDIEMALKYASPSRGSKYLK